MSNGTEAICVGMNRLDDEADHFLSICVIVIIVTTTTTTTSTIVQVYEVCK